MEDGHRLWPRRYRIIPLSGGRGVIDSPKGFIQPPSVFCGRNLNAVAVDRIQVGPFDDDLQWVWWPSFNGEMVSRGKTAFGRELFTDQFVAELDGPIPGILAETVFLEGELIRQIVVNIFVRLTARAGLFCLTVRDR